MQIVRNKLTFVDEERQRRFARTQRKIDRQARKILEAKRRDAWISSDSRYALYLLAKNYKFVLTCNCAPGSKELVEQTDKLAKREEFYSRWHIPTVYEPFIAHDHFFAVYTKAGKPSRKRERFSQDVIFRLFELEYAAPDGEAFRGVAITNDGLEWLRE